MKARIKRGIAAATALAAAAAVVVGFAGNSAADSPNAGLQAFGISSNGRLMAAFNTDTPFVLDWVRVPTGFVTDTALIGIDFRVQDRKLYAVGNYGGVYTVTLPTPPAFAEVTLTKVSQLTATLDGTTFGVDFNPAADRLRVISDTGQNLRHNLTDHTTTVDSFLSTGPGGPPLSGVTGAAYTNNDLDPSTATTLFDINTLTGQVAIQSPANNGFVVPTGSLGMPIAGNSGFDIFSDLSNGKTVSATAFGTFIPADTGIATLYTVNLLTGAAARVDEFPLQITDIAVALDSN